jgi:hypothetical protein
VNPRVLGDVDPVHGGGRHLPHGAGQKVKRACQSEHRPVVVGIRVHVESAVAARPAYVVDYFEVATLADVDNAFEEIFAVHHPKTIGAGSITVEIVGKREYS